MANKSVVLYESVKIKTEWKLQEVNYDLPKLSKGPLYVSWYEGSKKRMEPVGRDSEHALKMLNKKDSLRFSPSVIHAGTSFVVEATLFYYTRSFLKAQ